ncbi:hypothetical protein, partial [Lysinibacillus fusiformis]|uniref:hypothetical protein n=1 Tax=Lysinibacillus fusiformis TaxID=28031 RepID=UPI0020C0CF6D
KLEKANRQVVHLYVVSFQMYSLTEENAALLLYRVDHKQLSAHGSIASVETLSNRAVTLLQELVGELDLGEQHFHSRQNFLLEEILHVIIQALK